MSDYLSAERLFGSAVPRSWRPLLVSLARLDALLQTPPRAASARRQWQARLDRSYARLMAKADRLAEAAPVAAPAESEQHRRWFAQAVLLWRHYAASGGGVRVDTLGVRTLPRFPIDLPQDLSADAALSQALRLAFGWSEQSLEQMRSEVEALISNLKVKQAITAALAALFETAARGAASAADDPRPLDLMSRFLGPQPFRPADVHVVITHTAIFFCIPYEGERLLAPDFEARPPSERQRVTEFLRTLQVYATPTTDRFPAFGYFDSTRLDPTLVAALTASLRQNPEMATISETVVFETLITMVQILSTRLVEQYLIHDVWGHGWQESLGEFEWVYRKVSHLDDSVGPETGPFFGGDESPRLRDAFHDAGGRTRLQPSTLLQTVENDLTGRITVACNSLVSEMLADLVEHKFVRQCHPTAQEFPTSSVFPSKPQKLDLVIQDARQFLDLWRRPYVRLLEEAGEQRRLAEALAARGLPGAGLPEAVGAAAQLIRDRFWIALDPSTVVDVNGRGPATANLLQKILLNAVAFAAEIERFLDEADRTAAKAHQASPLWLRPEACIDLLVLLLGWFFEQDRARHFWHLDELLRSTLRPLIQRFHRALAGVATAS